MIGITIFGFHDESIKKELFKDEELPEKLRYRIHRCRKFERCNSKEK